MMHNLATGTTLASQVVDEQGEYDDMLWVGWSEVSVVFSQWNQLQPNTLVPSETRNELKFDLTPSDSKGHRKVEASVTLKDFVDIKLTLSPHKQLHDEIEPIQVFVNSNAFHIRYKRVTPTKPKPKEDSEEEETIP